MKNEKGITLTALIITMIVIFIIAGISLKLAIGDGFIAVTQEGMYKYELRNLQEELKTYHAKRELRSQDDYNPEGLYAGESFIAYVDGNERDDSKNIYDILDSLKGSQFDEKVAIEKGIIVFYPVDFNPQETEWAEEMGLKPKSDDRDLQITVSNAYEEDGTQKIDVTIACLSDLSPNEIIQYKYGEDGTYGNDNLKSSTATSITVTVNKEQAPVEVWGSLSNGNAILIEDKITIPIPTDPTDIQVTPTENTLTVMAEGSTSSVPGERISYIYRYSLDNGVTWSEASQPIPADTVYLIDGLKSNTDVKVEARAVVINDGNTGFESYPITKDTATLELKDITINSNPGEETWAKEKVLTISYGNNDSLPNGYQLQYKLGSEVEGVDQWEEWQSWPGSITVIENGKLVKVRIINSVLNDVKESARYKAQNIDRIPPTTPTSLTTTTENESTIDVKATGSEDLQSGLAGYIFSDDNGATWTLPVEEGMMTSFGPLSTGVQKNIQVKSVDNVGWESDLIQDFGSTLAIYNINYEQNTSSTVDNMPTSETKQKNVDYTISSAVPTRAGYTFKGWTTNAESTTPEFQPENTYSANANLTLYAIWESNAYTITLDNKLCTTPGTTSIYTKYSDEKESNDGLYLDNTCLTQMTITTSPIEIPTRTGNEFDGYNTFDGYYTEEYGQGTLMIDKDGYVTDNLMSSNYLANITLYANWTLSKYSINYETYLDGVKVEDNERIAVKLYVNEEEIVDLDKEFNYGSAYEIQQILIDGEPITFTPITGTLGADDVLIPLNFSTVQFTVNDANLGNISKTDTIVLNGTTYTTSGNTLTLSDDRTVLANIIDEVGYTTTLSWAPANGTISAATTITANFTRTENTATIYYFPNSENYTTEIQLQGNGATWLDNGASSLSETNVTYTQLQNKDLANVSDVFRRAGYHIESDETAWILNSTTATEDNIVNQASCDLSSFIENETNVVINLYANWQENTVTLKFYPNGDDVTVTDAGNNQSRGKWNGEYCQQIIKYTYSSDKDDASTYNMYNVSTLFTKTGYSVTNGSIAWIKDSPTSGTYVNQATYNVRSLMENGSVEINLYANWQENTVTLKFYPNGANNINRENTDTPKRQWYDSSTGQKVDMTNESTALTDDMYTVQTIKYTNSNASSYNMLNVATLFIKTDYQVTDDSIAWIKDSSTSGSYVNQASYDVKSLMENGSVEINLYANWQPKQVYIYWNTNGGTLNTNSTSVTVDSNGWVYDSGNKKCGKVNPGETYDLADYNNKNYLYTERTGYTVPSTQEWKTLDGSATFTQKGGISYDTYKAAATDKGTYYELNIYVNWQPKPILVRYNVNGGTLSPGSTNTRFTTADSNGWVIDNALNPASTYYNKYWIQKYDSSYHNTAGTHMVNLPNNNNTTYINIKRTGYTIESDKEWKTSTGSITFDHDKDYTPEEFYNSAIQYADDKGDHYELELYVNWKPNSTSTKSKLDLKIYLDGTVVKNTNAKVGLKVNGTKVTSAQYTNNCDSDGYTCDYWNSSIDIGTSYEVFGVQMNGTKYTLKTPITGMVNADKTDINVYFYTVNFASNNTDYGTISPTSLIVYGGTTYSTSGTTLTLSHSNLNSYSPTVTATKITAKGYDTNLSWSSTSGTVNAKDTTITATFTQTAKTVNVTFMRNTSSTDKTSATQTFTYGVSGQKFSDKGWTRTGYTLLGWNFDKDATTAIYRIENGVNNDWIESYSSTGATLYAIWKANTYTVSYNGNGSTSGSVANGTATYNANFTPAANGFTRKYTVTYNYNGSGASNTTANASYTFNNWNTSADGSGTTRAPGTAFKYTTTGNTTLYAQWTSKSVTLPTPKRDYYTFGGWYKEAACTNKVANGGASYTPKANITLYAKWTINQYTLTVNPNGGKWNNTTSNSTVKQNYNTTKALGNPTPATNTFTITYNYNGSGKANTTQTSANTFKNWTLQSGAKGSLNGTTYTFGAGNDTVTANYYHPAVKTPNPTRTGYTFGGWYKEAGCTNKIVNGNTNYTPSKSITLYAKWTANQYDLTIDPAGGSMRTPESNNEYVTTSYKTKFTYDKKYTYNGTSTDAPMHMFAETHTTVNDTFTNVSMNDTITNGCYEPYRYGYTFAGWKVKEGNKQYSLEESQSKIRTTNWTRSDYKANAHDYFYTGNYAGPVVITAVWTANKYTLTVNPNGGYMLRTKFSRNHRSNGYRIHV